MMPLVGYCLNVLSSPMKIVDPTKLRTLALLFFKKKNRNPFIFLSKTTEYHLQFRWSIWPWGFLYLPSAFCGFFVVLS